MKQTLFLAIAAAAVLIALAFGIYGWRAAAGAEIGMHGWIALVLGSALTIGVGGGLMALVFYSSRHGYDEDAHYEDDPDERI